MGTWFVRYAVRANPPILTARKRQMRPLFWALYNAKYNPVFLHTDQWAAYRQIQRQLCLNHRTVNHSLHFVDPVTGVHTQHAQSNWSTAKEKLKKMKGNTNPKFLIEYLHEFMWRRWYGDTYPSGCFQRLLQDIAEQNPL